MDFETLSLTELAAHNHPNDAWIAVNGVVWDVTGFADLHPGGAGVIEETFGKDASQVYNGVHGPGLIGRHFGVEKKVGKLTGVIPSVDNDDSNTNSTREETSKPPLTSILSMRDFEQAAQQRLSKKSWLYISGASNDCHAAAANHEWFQRIFFKPRVLLDVAECDTNISIFGEKFDLPIFNAPASLVKLAHPDGELAIARGMAGSGSTIIVPMFSSFSAGEIVESLPQNQPFFFQIYVNPDRAITAKALTGICALKPKAIIVTVDLPAFPKREEYERYEIQTARHAAESMLGGKSEKAPGENNSRSAGRSIASDLTWKDITWVRRLTNLPVVVKGIQNAQDAKTALDLGCDGIYVSNHGGSALDTAQPTIMTLLEIRVKYPEVFDRMEVFIDGGIRRGTDVLKCICLGAKGVCLGRPTLFAATYGAVGVQHAMQCKYPGSNFNSF